jgi:hypothetical protein
VLETRTLWDTNVFRLSHEESVIAPAFRDWIASSSSELGKYLANVRYASEFRDFSAADVRALESMIVKASVTKAAAIAPLRLLGKIVYRVNHTLQLSIPQPALAIHLTPPENPFVSGDPILAHRSVEAWLKAEQLWLEDLRKDPAFGLSEGRNVPFELLLLSAALHSGILNSDLAMGVRTAVMEPGKHIGYTNRLYVDLSLAWQGKPDQEIRRWYPDDGVACLLTRLISVEENSDGPYPESRRRFCREAHSRITAELRRRNVEEALLPESLGQFFECIALYLRSEIPAVMVGFATRQHDARSLLSPSIDHVYGDPRARANEPDNFAESEDEQSVNTEHDEAYGGDGLKDDEPDWMEPVRKGFAGATTKTLQANFDGPESDSPVARRIISFAGSLFKHGASSGKKLKPSSLKCCVLTVGRRLGRLLEERDPATIAPETLEDVYVRAIDDAARDSENPPHLQATVAWALREFHCFLRREQLAKPLNEADVFRVPRGILTVDAHMISVDDVFRTLDYLHYEPNPTWSDENREIAKMETLLGFFGGLRTMEGLGVPRQHFLCRGLLPFLVLPTDERGLKTPNAARMIPLATFMQPFDALVEYAAKWANATDNRGGQQGYARLFENASDDVIIPMIGEALRAVTGNDRLRYYSLRHAFASWTFTRLLLSDLTKIPDLFPHLPKTTAWLQHSKCFRRTLYGNDCVDNNHAWAVATLMGHATPSTSFGSYCHTFDILLPEFLRNVPGIERVLSTRDRLRLSSRLGRSAGYKRLPGGNHSHPNDSSGPNLEELISVAPDSRNEEEEEEEQIHEPQCAESKSVALPIPDEVRLEERNFTLEHLRNRFSNLQAEPLQLAPICNRSWLKQACGLLQMCAKPDRDFRGLAEYLGLKPEQARQFLARCNEICRLKSAMTGKDLHAAVSVDVQFGAQSDVAMVRIPRIPDAKALAKASEFAIRIARFVDKNHDHAASIFDFWSRNVVPGSGSIVFTMPSTANGELLPDPVTKARIKEYCHLLRALGIMQRDLDFSGCGVPDDAPLSTSWYRKWGLFPRKTCTIRKVLGAKAKRIAPGEWLAIGPARACPESMKDSTYRNGFRFAMLVASIRFGVVSSKPSA